MTEQSHNQRSLADIIQQQNAFRAQSPAARKAAPAPSDYDRGRGPQGITPATFAGHVAPAFQELARQRQDQGFFARVAQRASPALQEVEQRQGAAAQGAQNAAQAMESMPRRQVQGVPWQGAPSAAMQAIQARQAPGQVAQGASSAMQQMPPPRLNGQPPQKKSIPAPQDYRPQNPEQGNQTHRRYYR